MLCDTRLIGLAPKNVAEGDQICLLRGCSAPIILRRVMTAHGSGIGLTPTTMERHQVIESPFVVLNPAYEALSEKMLGDKTSDTRTMLKGERYFNLI
jgi:hypothetical protein